ncbi:uncharacterized protein LOC108960776 [Eucalyptus grandis]|uniref:uncharacterized protein LOC108960776 n=1 Tax=Eucalyptus grandis TaxID=71139 RepID=UPI00192EF3C6|nr:uncharacterized protein LOC108960776 [Eucalyptus grandis]
MEPRSNAMRTKKSARIVGPAERKREKNKRITSSYTHLHGLELPPPLWVRQREHSSQYSYRAATNGGGRHAIHRRKVSRCSGDGRNGELGECSRPRCCLRDLDWARIQCSLGVVRTVEANGD